MSDHEWRTPKDGEVLEEGAVCTKCELYVSQANEPCIPTIAIIDAIKGGALAERYGDLWIALANGISVQLTKTGDWYGVLDDDDEGGPEDGDPQCFPVVEVFGTRESIRCVAESEDEAFRIIKRLFREEPSGVSFRVSEVPFARDPA